MQSKTVRPADMTACRYFSPRFFYVDHQRPFQVMTQAVPHQICNMYPSILHIARYISLPATD